MSDPRETYNATTAAFIAAASPDRVKALIEEKRALEAALKGADQ